MPGAFRGVVYVLPMLLTAQSPPGVKIALFRLLFRGREEVYPRRFESRKTGRAGYQPVCGNEWIRGICEKPRIKCSECPHQRWHAGTCQGRTGTIDPSSWASIR